jgi:hypothetical protein
VAQSGAHFGASVRRSRNWSSSSGDGRLCACTPGDSNASTNRATPALALPPRQRRRDGGSSTDASLASNAASNATIATRSNRTSHAGAISRRVVCAGATGPDQPSR